MVERVNDYHDGNRYLQDRFDTRRIADHIASRTRDGCNRAIPRIWATQKLVFFKGKSIAYEVRIEMALDWE